MKKKKYEDVSHIIDQELQKRRGSWYLKAIAWMDYDDVCQIIRKHILEKWDKWDQSRPIEPWVNTIITNQMINILRNKYGSFVRPCLKCDFNQGGESKFKGESVGLCGYTPSGKQCGECSLYAKWEKGKKHAYNIKLPVYAVHHDQEIFNRPSEIEITEEIEQKLHGLMKKELTERQYFAYEKLIIKDEKEEDVAKAMGFYSNESSRKAGYRQIKNLKKMFRDKAAEIIDREDVLIYPKQNNGY